MRVISKVQNLGGAKQARTFYLDHKRTQIDGEREIRLYHVSVWEESPLFSPKENVALFWTEHVTKLSLGARMKCVQYIVSIITH